MPSPRGFACLAPEHRTAIARAGGVAAQAAGTAHRFTPEEARAAGRRGGAAISQNAQHMAEIGRRGGLTRAERARTRAA